ncbi:MAG: hypothetical protein Q7K39_00145 [Candidatus Magasanikbacteria bacterium]|nr:hypothetical protein [Candidatus Magasanikbacteria bacterium]
MQKKSRAKVKLSRSFFGIGVILLFVIFQFFPPLRDPARGGTIFNSSVARAATAPALITYQGKMLNSSNFAITTTVAMKFVLYSASSGGTALYTASGTLPTTSTINVTPTNGLFSINLGDTGTNSLDSSIFQNNQTIYLEISVAGETLTPRKQITASPFSFNSKYLDGVAATSSASTSTYIPISDSSGNFSLRNVTSTGLAITGTSTFPGSGIWGIGGVWGSSGKVGIGTTTPGYSLDIWGNGGGAGTRVRINDPTYAILTLGTPSIPFAANVAWDSGANALELKANSNAPSSTVDIYTNDIRRMIITASGTVGIGTASPGYTLDVQGTLGVSSTSTLATTTITASKPLLVNRILSTDAIATGITLQNQTFSPGGTHTAVDISPIYSAEDESHNAVRINAQQNGAAASLYSLDVYARKATAATTLTTMVAGAFNLVPTAGTITNGYNLVVQNQTGAGIFTNTAGLQIFNLSTVGGATSYGIHIDTQSANATTTRAINLSGVGVSNAIRMGGSANIYANAANNLRFADSTNVRGLDFNLTAAGDQTITSFGGGNIAFTTTTQTSSTITTANITTLNISALNPTSLTWTNATGTNLILTNATSTRLHVSGTSFTSDALLDFTTGRALTGSRYQIGRNTDGNLQFNVPAVNNGFRFSANGVPFMNISSTNITIGSDVVANPDGFEAISDLYINTTPVLTSGDDYGMVVYQLTDGSGTIANSLTGLFMQVGRVSDGATYTGGFTGGQFIAQAPSTGSVSSLIGVNAYVSTLGASVNDATGILGQVSLSGGAVTTSIALNGSISSSGGTHINAYGLYIAPISATAGTIANVYGARIEAPATGTTKWTLGVGTGNSYVRGSLVIGASSTPAYALDIQGTLGVSATSTFTTTTQVSSTITTANITTLNISSLTPTDLTWTNATGTNTILTNATATTFVVTGNEQINGALGLGTAPLTSAIFRIATTTALTGGTNVPGISNTVTVNSAANSGSYIADSSNLTTAGLGAVELSGSLIGSRGTAASAGDVASLIGSLEGLRGTVNISGGTVTSSYALRAQEIISAGTSTQMAGLYIPAITSSGGFIGTSYGFLIDAPGVGGTQWTAGIGTGNSYVRGSLVIGASSTPAYALDIQGTLGVSATSTFTTTTQASSTITNLHITTLADFGSATVTGLASADLSDTANIALLDANQTFTGNNTLSGLNTFSNTTTFTATTTFRTSTFSSSTITTANISTLNGTTILGTTFNGLTITNNGTNVLTIAAGKTLTANNSIAFTGTDSTTMTLPTVSATLAGLAIDQTFTGLNTFSNTTTFTATTTFTTTTQASSTITTANIGTLIFSSLGLVSSPVMRNATDTDTGIYFPSATAVGITTNGAERFSITDSAAILTQAARTSGTSTALTVIGGAHTSLTATAEVIDLDLAFNRTLQWAAGNVALQRAALLRAPTYSFTASSTISEAATFAVDRSPVVGSFATLTLAYTLGINSSGDNSAAEAAIGAAIVPPGIAAGKGAADLRIGLAVVAPGASSINLGNQTSTLTGFFPLYIASVGLAASSTRTITNVASAYILGAPSNIANVTFTNGPYAFWVDADTSRFDGSVTIGGTSSTPAAKLEVIDGAIMASGTTGATPGSGIGTRLMWIPAKAAFRAGQVTGDQWDDGNIGASSTALGYNTLASGNSAVVIGSSSTASGISSVAIGALTFANNTVATAIGYAVTASGVNSVGLGTNLTASATGSMALGNRITVSGENSFGIGVSSTVYSLSAANTFAVVGGRSLFGTTTLPTTTFQVYVDGGADTSPGLGVRGYIQASGFITASASLDLAELYPISMACYETNSCPEPGDAVCLTGGLPARIEKCGTAYSPKAIGIVSANPGFTLGGLDSSTTRKVALAGRVPLKILAANKVIRAGDRLTTSDIPGFAQKASEPGPTIAIAAEDYPSETSFEDGTILAFVNNSWAFPNGVLEATNTPPRTDGFWGTILQWLKQFGIEIEQGVLRVKEFFADKIHTQILCVGDTCVDESKLKDLLNNSALSPAVLDPLVTLPPSSPAPAPVLDSQPAPTTADPSVDLDSPNVATTTETVIIVTDTAAPAPTAPSLPPEPTEPVIAPEEAAAPAPAEPIAASIVEAISLPPAEPTPSPTLAPAPE